MRRAIAIVLVAVAGLAAIVAVTAAILVSPIGRAGIASIAEREIAEVVGGKVKIGAVKGNLTRRMEFQDVRFTDKGKVWASVETIAVDWSPMALFGRRLVVTEALIENASLASAPPGSRKNEPFKVFELPDRFPSVEIDRVVLRNLQASKGLVGNPLRLDGDGSVEMGGRAIAVRASLAGTDDRDTASVVVERKPGGGKISVTIKVASKADGVIAALARAGGPVNFSVEGAGTPRNYQLAIAGTAGEFGTLKGALSGDIETFETIAFEFAAIPGARFAGWREDLGDTVRAKGAFHPALRGGRLTLAALQTAAGDIAGEASWRNSASALDTADAKVEIEFTESWRPEIQEIIGARAEAIVALELRQRRYMGSASVTTPFLAASIADLSTDLRTRAEGSLTVDASAESHILAAVKTPASGDAFLTFEAGEAIGLRALKISTTSGLTFDGEASYGLASRSIEADGAITASAAAVKTFEPSLSPRGDVSGRVALAGAANNFALRLTARTPLIAFNESTFPPASVSLDATGLPASPFAKLSARAVDGSLATTVDIRGRVDGLVSLSNLDHRGREFALTGEASLNAKSREVAVDLRYAGREGAEPWPGLTLVGEASARGAIRKGRADNRLEFSAPALRSNSWTADGVSILARGPIDRLSVTLSAGAMTASDRARFDNVKISGVATLDRQPALKIASGSAEYGAAPIRLTREADIRFDGGVALKGLALSVGDSGAIELDGVLSPRRWQANAKIRNLELANSGAMLDFALVLDTNNRIAATGEFEAASALSASGDAKLSGSYSWDGRQFKVVAGGDKRALDVDLSLPLELKRSDRLRLSAAGALAGNARFDGRAETIALFLPLAFQSLEGSLTLTGTLAGTLQKPRVDGALTLTDGGFTEPASGLSIVDIDLDATTAGTISASAIEFSGTASGPGQSAKTIASAGKIDLGNGVSLSAAVTLTGARFSAGPVERVDATGALSIEGGIDDLLVSGDLSISQLQASLIAPPADGLVEIDVIVLDRNGRPPAHATASRRKGALRYAIRISADDKVFVDGGGLNSEWRAKAQISGTAGDPLILGTLNLQRGDLEFSGRRFNLTRGSIGFDTLVPNDPTIDLRAEREAADGTTVAVIVGGRSSALKVTLESTPSRPSEDVMALILFDKPADELSAFQSLQVADALTQIGGVGVFGGKGVAGAARDLLGLDLLNIEIDAADSSASLLTVGKYVTDGLFVSASQSARGENGSLRIEYEIGQSFSIETELQQDGDQTVSANWKKDF